MVRRAGIDAAFSDAAEEKAAGASFDTCPDDIIIDRPGKTRRL